MRGIIFDLDGVLLSTDHYHYLAWKQIADEIGVLFDECINHRLRGISRMDSLEIILGKYQGYPITQVEKEAFLDKKNGIYKAYLEELTSADVSIEVRKTLEDIQQLGIKMAIGSSSKNARFILEKVELIDMFDAISDGNNISKSKPDPEVFLKAAAYLELLPKQCVVVEDSTAGIDAAKAGGMLAIAIGEATNYDKSDVCLNSFSELSRVVQNNIKMQNAER